MSAQLADWLPSLPSGWSMKPFYCVFTERKQPNVGLAVDNVLSLSYGRIVERDVESNHGLLPASFEGYNIVEPRDIVMRLTDLQNDQRSLRTGQVEERGVITSAYVTVTPAAEIHPRFAHYLLHGYDLAKLFYRMGGGLRQSMKFDDLKRMPVVLPPPADQERIANFLDVQTARIDALIAEKEKLRAALSNWQAAELTRHCFGTDLRQVETGNLWIPSLPAGWKAARLKHLVDGVEQGWSPECEARLAEAEEWGVLKAGAANGGIYREDEHKALPSALEPIPSLEVKAGDVLITRASGTADYVGSFAFVYKTRAKLMLSDKNFRLRFGDAPKVLPELLAWSANTFSIRQQVLQYVSGADGLAKNIGSGNLREVWFPVPPLDKQPEIVSRLRESRERVATLDAHLTDHLARLREYRAALISAAVSGQLSGEDKRTA